MSFFGHILGLAWFQHPEVQLLKKNLKITPKWKGLIPGGGSFGGVARIPLKKTNRHTFHHSTNVKPLRWWSRCRSSQLDWRYLGWKQNVGKTKGRNQQMSSDHTPRNPLIRPYFSVGYFLGETWHCWGIALDSHDKKTKGRNRGITEIPSLMKSMISKSPNWGYSPSKWPFHGICKGVILITYKSWYSSRINSARQLRGE